MVGVNVKPVMPTLRRMKVGDTEAWPIERLEVVRISVGRMNAMKRAEGWKLTMKTEGLVINVTRTA